MTQSATAVSRYTETHIVSPALLELTLFGLGLSELPKRHGGAAVIGSDEPDDEGEAAD